MNDNHRADVLPPQFIATAAAHRFSTAFEETIAHCAEHGLKPHKCVMTISIAIAYALKRMGTLLAQTGSGDQLALTTLQIMRSHIMMTTSVPTAMASLTADVDSAVKAARLANVPPTEIIALLCHAINDLGGLQQDEAQS